mmetsp:Transcript_10774/g.45216  ORF Transcript_10774/g.45216 Transcript_10774/m.45216 type:complete len:432 (+) Transcript_10774:1655-2950(+)
MGAMYREIWKGTPARTIASTCVTPRCSGSPKASAMSTGTFPYASDKASAWDSTTRRALCNVARRRSAASRSPMGEFWDCASTSWSPHHISSSRAVASHSALRQPPMATCRKPCAVASAATRQKLWSPLWSMPTKCALSASPSTPAPEHCSARAITTNASSSSAISARRYSCRVETASSGASLRIPVSSAWPKYRRTETDARNARITAAPSLPNTPSCPASPLSSAHIAPCNSSIWACASGSTKGLSASTRSSAPVALKNFLSSAANRQNSLTKSWLYCPSCASTVILRSIASTAMRSSGPALRWILFCNVCLISFFRSWGMSLRCAMSRMRVMGTEQVNSLEKLGSHGCRWRMIWRSTEDTGAPCLPYSGFRPATVSRLMKTSRETTAGRSGRWWWPSSAHSMCPAAIQRKNVEVAASFSTESAWPCPTMD